MKSATLIQCKTIVLRQMKFHENIHKDRGLWSCDIRKKQQEALESIDKIFSCRLWRFQVSLHFQQKVDDMQFEMPTK